MPEDTQPKRRQPPIQKHPIETYKHYTIYIISGMTPTWFLAEKKDATKGPTMSADDLDELKMNIDKTLKYMASIHISSYEGPDNSQVLQNPKTRIRSTAGEFDGFAIMIESDYDIDVIVETVENAPVRPSKKHHKQPKKTHLIRILYRDKTHVYS